jgi:hypothetical protein
MGREVLRIKVFLEMLFINGEEREVSNWIGQSQTVNIIQRLNAALENMICNSGKRHTKNMLKILNSMIKFQFSVLGF